VSVVALTSLSGLGSPRLVALLVVTPSTSLGVLPALLVTTTSIHVLSVSALVVALPPALPLVVSSLATLAALLLLTNVRLFRVVVLLAGHRPLLPVLVEPLVLPVERLVPVAVVATAALLAGAAVSAPVLGRVCLLAAVAEPPSLLFVLAALLPLAGRPLALLPVGRPDAALRMVLQRVRPLEFGLPPVALTAVALVRVLPVLVALSPLLVAVSLSSTFVPSLVSVVPGHYLDRRSTPESDVACACDCNRRAGYRPGEQFGARRSERRVDPAAPASRTVDVVRVRGSRFERVPAVFALVLVRSLVLLADQ
jgi:hypothetical protein